MAEEGAANPRSMSWRGQSASHSAKRPPGRTSRWGRLIALTACGLALAGVLAGLALRLQREPQPFLLSIPIAEYRSPAFPINSFAREDSNALARYFPNVRQPLNDEQRNRLTRELDELRSVEENKVVVYLSALAVVRGDKVYLLAVDADPLHPEASLTLSDLFHDLKDCPARNKLLILDIMRPFADAELGIVTNDVASAVKKAVAQVDDPHLWVLCPCSPGEAALPAEEMRQSAFGYYVSRGLGGEANGAGPTGKQDQFITVQELAAYVQSKVSRWARQNRAARQTPVLYPPHDDTKGDFKLMPVSEQEAPVEQEPVAAPPPTYPDWLAQGWRRRDQWEDAQLYRVTPATLAGVEADLLGADERWRAGGTVDKVQSALAAALDVRDAEFKVTRAETAPADAPVPFALALTPEAASGPDPNIAKEFAELAVNAAATPPAPDPKKTAGGKNDAEPAKAVDAFLKKYGTKPKELLAWTIFTQVASDPAVTFAKVQLARGLIEKLKLPGKYAEIILLRRVVARGATDWPGATIHDLLGSMQEEGQILAADPRALTGLYDQLTAAARKRLAVEKTLFNPDDATTSEDDGPARSFVLDAYQQINGVVRPRDRAYRLCDRARAVLPGYVPYLLARTSADDSPAQAWNAAVQAVVDIDGLLADPAVQRLHRPLSELDDTLRDNLPRPFEDREIATLTKPEAVAEQLPAYLKLNARLAGAPFRASVRITAWQAADGLGRALWDRLQDEDSGKRAAQPSGAVTPTAGPWQSRQIKLRASTAIALLKLAGAPEVADLEASLIRVGNTATDADWQKLGEQLKTALQRQKSERPGRLAKERDSYAAARQDLWRWLGKQYLSQYDALPENSADRNYFKDAAREYLREP